MVASQFRHSTKMRSQTESSFESIAMEIVRAELTDAKVIAELNRCLIKDEQHPNSMDINQLTERMKKWLGNEYVCYLAKENGSIIAYCLYRHEGKYFYMRQLYVARKHR